MTVLPAFLLASALILAGTHVAIAAAGFVVGPWLGAGAEAASMGGAFFAPFALVAIVAPCVAAPLSRRLLRGRPFTAPGPIPATLMLFLLCEVLLAFLALAGGGSPLGASPLLHAVLFVYCALGAWLFQRRTEDADTTRDPV